MNEERESALLRSQQGEMDAVLMYRRLAETAKDERDRQHGHGAAEVARQNVRRSASASTYF